MNARADMIADDVGEAIEAGITAASEEISCLGGLGKRWRQWGTKEMLIAGTAATTAVAKWRQLREGADADITS
jgi:hypothetical protein